ncbi:MAG: heme o synthase [Verrucomicrobia subdivision 3 bacterium]|nr:heme o synthase [Limisphaerales bacterium]
MKATAEPITAPAATEKSWLVVFSELVKARLTFLVLITTLVGFYVGASGALDWTLMVHTLAGTALLACGAAALNQLIEREHDAKMRRTECRPLPSGRLTPNTVLIFGGACSIAGLVYLAAAVNPLTGLLGAITLVTYVFVYTPLKRVTWLNTAIGAVPGALPPLMGWTAATNELSPAAWCLFGILFFWQIPHFLAIAWMYRDEYAKAGFVMLPAVDPEGSRTAHYAVSHTLGLLFASLSPVLFGLTGSIYMYGALIIGLAFLAAAFAFGRRLDVARARQLFFASIIYLPLLLGLMVLDKIRY